MIAFVPEGKAIRPEDRGLRSGVRRERGADDSRALAGKWTAPSVQVSATPGVTGHTSACETIHEMRNPAPSGPGYEERLRFFNYIRHLGRTIAWAMIVLLIGIASGTFFLREGSSAEACLLLLALCVIPVAVLTVVKPGRRDAGG